MLKTILIVGASPTARALLPTLLRNWPATIISAPDVLSAIHVADRVRVHAIIADKANARVGAQDLTEFAARFARLRHIHVHVLRGEGGEAAMSDLATRADPALCNAATPADPIAALPRLISAVELALRP